MSTDSASLDADQQLIEELLEAELGQRRVAEPGERLDLVWWGGVRLHGPQDRLAGPGRVMVRISRVTQVIVLLCPGAGQPGHA